MPQAELKPAARPQAKRRTFDVRLQAALRELRKTADVVIPLVSDRDRELLKRLEAAGIEFVGTNFEAGETAAHKHRCRHQRTLCR